VVLGRSRFVLAWRRSGRLASVIIIIIIIIIIISITTSSSGCPKDKSHSLSFDTILHPL